MTKQQPAVHNRGFREHSTSCVQ